MDKTVINFRLSELRKARHITQGELAEIVGTSFQTISNTNSRSSYRQDPISSGDTFDDISS